MATKAQIDELIRQILAQGDTLLGLDALVEGLAQDIADALTMLPRPEAVAAARRRAETLRQILRNAEATRIANVVADVLEEGGTPADVRRRIREHVGLTARDERALEKLRQELLDDGVNPDDIAAQLQEEYDARVNQRAADIAHHEIGDALEEGNQEAARAGGATHKANVDTGEDRVCEQCQAATAQGVILIDQPYVTGVMHPPHHNKCRCSEAYFTEPSQERIDRINAQQQARLDRIAQAQDAGGPGEDRR